MSKVLQFFGLGKKSEGQGFQLVQEASARAQNEGAVASGADAVRYSNMNSGQNIQTGQAFSSNLPHQRSNIVAPDNADARNKIDLFRSPQNIVTSSIQSGQATPYQSNFVKSTNYVSNSATNISPVYQSAIAQLPNNNLYQSQVQNPVIRSMSAIEVYSTPVKPIEYDEIRAKLTNFVDRTFPSPFPSRVSHPDDFDFQLTNRPYPANQIEYLLENSKYSDKSKETQKNKFLTYKKEAEFYKKYINMNEVKKQKLIQEIEDHKRRTGVFQSMSQNDPSYRQTEYELMRQEDEIAREKQELEQIRQQLEQYGHEDNAHYADDHQAYDHQSFVKKQAPYAAYMNDSQQYAYNDRPSQHNDYADYGNYQNQSLHYENVDVPPVSVKSVELIASNQAIPTGQFAKQQVPFNYQTTDFDVLADNRAQMTPTQTAKVVHQKRDNPLLKKI